MSKIRLYIPSERRINTDFPQLSDIALYCLASSLPTGEKNILTLIAAKLICATAPAHKYEAVKLTGICNGTEFTATGRTVLEMGWKAYIKQSDKKNDEKSLPAVSEGQTFTVTASKSEHFTSLPKPYTEDTLLSAMERAGNEEYDEDTEKKDLALLQQELP